MARLRRDTDLKTLAFSRYSLLMAKRTGIEEELKGIEAYLKAIGQDGTKGVSRSKDTGKLPYEKRLVSNRARKESATKLILSLIEGSDKGISID